MHVNIIRKKEKREKRIQKVHHSIVDSSYLFVCRINVRAKFSEVSKV